MSEDYKKYDTQHTLVCHNVRLTADAKVISDTFVKVTFALSSKNEKDMDIWIDAVPLDGAAPLAAHLKKGDVLSVEGFLTMQKWGDNDNLSHTIKFAKLHYPLDLLMKLRERKDGAKPATKSTATKKPIAKPRVVVDLDGAGDDIQ